MTNDTEPYRNETTARKLGRPRSAEHDAAILEAALRLMQRDGYARLSMDAVAAEAGTTKAAIYRRHASKAELATAALAFLRDQREPPESDDAYSDLVEELSRFRAGVERPHGMAMLGTVLAEEEHVPELIAAFRRDVVLPRRERLRSILSRARLRAGIDVETAINMAIGSYYAEYLAQGRPSKDWARSVADAFLVQPK